MCKIGILAIGADLYHSAFKHFEALLFLLQRHQSYRNVTMDLTAHFVALMTLVLALRGRVNRQATGRVVFPVLAVKFVLEMEASQWQQKQVSTFSVHEILVIVKSVMFLIITAKLAFGKDTSYVASDEWLPKKVDDIMGNMGKDTIPGEVEGEEGNGEETKQQHCDKKTK